MRPPLSVTGLPDGPVMWTLLVTSISDWSVIVWPARRAANTIESPFAASTTADRNEPAPLSLRLLTTIVLNSTRGSSA